MSQEEKGAGVRCSVMYDANSIPNLTQSGLHNCELVQDLLTKTALAESR
jgi:hypothetical protein